jgi:hypothetical protein
VRKREIKKKSKEFIKGNALFLSLHDKTPKEFVLVNLKEFDELIEFVQEEYCLDYKGASKTVENALKNSIRIN